MEAENVRSSQIEVGKMIVLETVVSTPSLYLTDVTTTTATTTATTTMSTATATTLTATTVGKLKGESRGYLCFLPILFVGQEDFRASPTGHHAGARQERAPPPMVVL